jgi:hypothetical protein
MSGIKQVSSEEEDSFLPYPHHVVDAFLSCLLEAGFHLSSLSEEADHDLDQANSDQTQSFAGGIDHVRVHPKFLHSNATSHRWALGGMFFVFDCNSLLLNL